MERIIHPEAIKRANESVEAALQEAAHDPHRLAYHASPPVYWMNDPNGLIHYKGEYHLFYQHNPYSEQWGDIHWAHMKSKDLVHWEQLPIALAPSEEYDIDGCFSGSAVEHEGKMYVFYTSNLYTTPAGLPDDLLQQQCAAVSADGIHFKKLSENPVIKAPPEPIGQTNHFRDPKVWKHQDNWYMVLGAKKYDRGKVLVYKSADLIHWEFLNVVTESDGSMGYMHECPDLFSVGGKDVLLLSPEGAGTKEDPRLSGYYIGEFDYETGHYRHEAFRRLDYGFDFYAPQTMQGAGGRRILFGWMPMDGKALNKKWAGAMTIPREVKYSGGNRLQIEPVEEMKRLRGLHHAVGEYRVTAGQVQPIPGISGECVEMIVTYDLQTTDAIEFGLQVRCSEDGREKTVIKYDRETAQVIFDRNDSGAGDKGVRGCTIEDGQNRMLRLHIFLDRSALELFINQGDYVMSGFIFPEETSQGIRFFANGGTALIHSIDFWQLAL
ncbi:glycoside hydrolase family 32 protein [Cohnella kolymensis]|uniref:glycoside hydrolase family 32 protein n=1 Tax=Cohnella kolymensis TaxID=1590652 RepID=UPI000A93A7B5|nr:glycoside hydrolase family 32 protein [Cohnella kolymensis]